MEEFVGEQLEFKNVPWRNSGEGNESYFLALADLPGTSLTRTAVLGRARGNDLDKQPADQVELYPLFGEALILLTQTDNIWLPHYLRSRQVRAFNLEIGQISDQTVLTPIEELRASEMMVKLRHDKAALILAKETQQILSPYIDLVEISSEKRRKQTLRHAALRIKVEDDKPIEGQAVSAFGLDSVNLLTKGSFNAEDFFTFEDQEWFKQFLDKRRHQTTTEQTKAA